MRAGLLMLLCLVGVAAVMGADSTNVQVLTEASFDGAVSGSKLMLVEFFAPWCGHCKQLAPQYETAAGELKGVADLASVDCTVEKELCNKYGVQGFPTLKIFRGLDAKPVEYQGGRKSADIVKYMKKQGEPAYITLENDAALTAFTGREGVKVVAFVSSADSAEGKAFIDAANGLRNEYSFAISTDSAAATKYGAAPVVVLFKDENGAATHVSSTGAITAESVDAFIKAEAFPIVGDIGPENFQSYLDRGLPLVWVFVDLKSDETKNVIEAATAAATAFKGKLSVVKLDGVRWGEHAKHFGLSGKLPGIVAEDREENKNYVFDESAAVTAEALKAHFQGFIDGTLTATLKSQEIPEKNDGPVTTLVGKNFESIVFDEKKDVFVEFYAPWCGHCKSLAPKFEKLGEAFAKDDSVVIAQIDATENDAPYSVQGFPTLVFWPANDKKNPIPYEGDRTVAAMEKFIRDNAATLKKDGAAATPAAHEEL